MNANHHTMSELFDQLGLPSGPAQVSRFIASHRVLSGGQRLADAGFWTPSQAEFLREQVRQDADWAVLIDTLSVQLRATSARLHA